jgi:hypothetical protein
MNDLDELRRLAGLTDISGNTTSPVSGMTGTQKAEIMRQQNIRPGTDAWFKLWFSKQWLTGEKPI